MATLTACGEARRDAPANVPRDVPIVEQPARHGSAATLTLDDAIVRDIGGLKASAEDEFDHLNGFLTGVVLSDGGFVVIDGPRVRRFDAAGVQVAVVGRPGRGPGEFVGLTELCRFAGDSVLVFDQVRRLAVIGPAGDIVRETTLPDLAIMSAGCFDDGSFLGQAFEPRATGMRTALAVRRRTDGSVADTLGVFPVYGFRGVAQYVRLHVRGAWVYASDPRVSEVQRYRADGTLDRVLRTADTPRRMPPEDVERWLGGPVAAAGSGTTAGAGARAPAADATWPFYRDLRIDASGRLWMRDFPDGPDAPDRFAIYDSKFAFVGRLDLPRGAPVTLTDPRTGSERRLAGEPPTVVDAQGDAVILLVRDADGAAHFVTRRLRPLARGE